MVHQEHTAHYYLRQTKRFPNVWCSGCGIGVVMSALIRAIDRLELPKDDVAVVSGIGCTGRMPVYLDFNTMDTTHGRALAFATGLKLARPKLHVIVIMGDGDAVAIGGNHFMHAARRNMDLTAIVVNNSIYGMTGGQYSPMTPLGGQATTAPYGNVELPLPMCEIAVTMGVPFVARSTVYHATELDHLIELGIQTKGFSLVEAVSYCHTTYGHLNKRGSAVDMMRSLKENSVTVANAEKLSAAERAGKIVRGILREQEDCAASEYTVLYDRVIKDARKVAEAERPAGGSQ